MSLSRLLMLCRLGHSRGPPPLLVVASCFRMYNDRAIASLIAISADARAILTKPQLTDDPADCLVEYIVESEGLAPFDNL